MNARQEIGELRQFLAAPRRMPRRPASNAPWVARSLFFAMVSVALGIAMTLLLLPLADWAGVHNRLPDRPGPGVLITALIFAPVIEELVFRAGLRSAGYSLFIAPPLIALMATSDGRGLWIASELAAFVLIVSLANRWIRLRRAGGHASFARQFIENYRWVFWGYATMFALLHVGNYGWSGPRGAWVALMVLPQFVTGTLAGYVRLRDGLRSSVLLHFSDNAFAMSLTLLP